MGLTLLSTGATSPLRGRSITPAVVSSKEQGQLSQGQWRAGLAHHRMVPMTPCADAVYRHHHRTQLQWNHGARHGPWQRLGPGSYHWYGSGRFPFNLKECSDLVRIQCIRWAIYKLYCVFAIIQSPRMERGSWLPVLAFSCCVSKFQVTIHSSEAWCRNFIFSWCWSFYFHSFNDTISTIVINNT